MRLRTISSKLHYDTFGGFFIEYYSSRRLVNNLQTPTTAGGAPTWSISIDEDSDFNLEDDILDPVRASRKKVRVSISFCL